MIDAEFVREQVMPYYYTEFKMGENGSLVPLDLHRVLADPFLENLVRGKLDRLRTRVLPQYQALITAINEVCASIDSLTP